MTQKAHAVQASEWQYRSMVENMRDVLWILDPLTLQFLYVSPSVELLRGFTPAEVMAEPMDAALTEESARHVRGLITSRMRALEEGTAPIDASYVEEVEQPCKDGSTVWTEVVTRYVRDESTGRIEVYGVTRDIAARRAAVAALAESEQHYRLLANNMSDVVAWIGGDGTYKWVSPSLTEVLGWKPEDWVGRSAADNTHPDDTDRFRQQREAMTAGRITLDHGAWVDRFRAQDSSGQYHWLETRTRAYIDGAGRPDGAIVTFHLIDELIDNELELLRRATYDDLTGALKSEAAIERLEAMRRGQRSAGDGTAILFIDVDGLKEVNDSHGHLAGNALLSTLGARYTASVRSGDSVARMGGDEFLIILESVHGIDDALAVAHKVKERSRTPIAFGDLDLRISVSIGVALIDPSLSVDDNVAAADHAMYAAKRQGGDAIVAVPPVPRADV